MWSWTIRSRRDSGEPGSWYRSCHASQSVPFRTDPSVTAAAGPRSRTRNVRIAPYRRPADPPRRGDRMPENADGQRGTEFTGADLTGARFRKVHLNDARFRM